jgi:predicted outer membrane repeat protein
MEHFHPAKRSGYQNLGFETPSFGEREIRSYVGSSLATCWLPTSITYSRPILLHFFKRVTKLMTRKFTPLGLIYLFFVVIEPSFQMAYAGSGRTLRIPKDYSSIQKGIENAVDGDTILVNPGTYHENINFQGKKIVLASHFILKGDTTKISKTILDGSKSAGSIGPANKDSASVVSFVSGEDSSSVIIGFTIQNGEGTLVLEPKGYGGGGILCKSSSPKIIRNIIQNNSAYAYGGGIYCQDGSPQIIQNMVMSNSANTYGGAIFCNNASPQIEENILQYNSAKYGRGGGIHCYSSTPLIERNLILENTCYLEGGGVCCESLSSASIINNTFVRNQGIGGSGIGCIKSSSPKIVNNIISFGEGVSMWCDKSSNPLITHNDFWKNQGENYGSCEPPSNNLFVDPLFIDLRMGDYHLKKDSPCIDFGDTTLVYGEGGRTIQKDPDGTKPDLGALYFHKQQ